MNYQLVDDDTTPPKVLSPVYAPARVIVPGTKIPQYVILDEKVEVAVVFGIWIWSVVGVVDDRASPDPYASDDVPNCWKVELTVEVGEVTHGVPTE